MNWQNYHVKTDLLKHIHFLTQLLYHQAVLTASQCLHPLTKNSTRIRSLEFMISEKLDDERIRTAEGGGV